MPPKLAVPRVGIEAVYFGMSTCDGQKKILYRAKAQPYEHILECNNNGLDPDERYTDNRTERQLLAQKALV